MLVKGLPREVHYVLLDYDGTLIDLRPKWWYPIENSFTEVAGEVPTDQLSERVSDIMANLPRKPSKLFFLRTLWEIGRSGGLSRIDTVRFILIARDKFAESKYINELLPGSEDFVQLVKQHDVPIAIVTTATNHEIQRAKQDLQFLGDLPTVSRDDVENLKPHPEPLNKAMQLIDAIPENTVFIGDFDTDIIAGKNAGVMTVGLLGVAPKISEPGLKLANPDLLIGSLADLNIMIERSHSS